ncbi:DNA-binding protein [Oceanicaulis alexandrii]|uniref:DNA-binding protein n=1 Tax=Oceanicaulis alexandrii TaxID=153233 RepID=UPI003B514ADE
MTAEVQRAGEAPGANGEGASSVGADLLEGAGEIALFLWGKDKPTKRRQIYHLVESEAIPIFRMGQRIYARRSTLTAWIEKQEAERCKR